jgi:hypothetical protein
MTKKELAEQLMKMPELEDDRSECCGAKLVDDTDLCSDCKEHTGQEPPSQLIHKRMNDINTFQAHDNEVYLRGTDEYGQDFQICFDSYNFLEWIDTEHLEYIKEQLTKYIKKK